MYGHVYVYVFVCLLRCIARGYVVYATIRVSTTRVCLNSVLRLLVWCGTASCRQSINRSTTSTCRYRIASLSPRYAGIAPPSNAYSRRGEASGGEELTLVPGSSVRRLTDCARERGCVCQGRRGIARTTRLLRLGELGSLGAWGPQRADHITTSLCFCASALRGISFNA